MAPTGTRSDDADLAVTDGKRLDEIHRRFAVPDDAVVRDAALAAHLGRHVLWCAMAETMVEVRADHDVAMVG